MNIGKSGPKLFALMLVLLVTLTLVPVAIATVTDKDMDDNTAPIAKNLEYATYKGVAISGTLQAVDPEGDMIEYKLITEPKKGTAKINEDGQFSYTPAEGKKGKDSFTYAAVDAYGNVSEEATVKIVIEKQSTSVTYSDMEGNSSYYAAIRLAEEEIFIGEVIGDKYFFNPDLVVTRGEFLAMCLSVSGEEILEGISRTGFADDEEISNWLKPYITTALMSGTIKGMKSLDGDLVFAPDEGITMAQAVVVLNQVIDIADVSDEVDSLEELTVPAWAYQATANLSAANIIEPVSTDVYDNVMTRAQAAELLCSAIDVINESGEISLLSWAQ